MKRILFVCTGNTCRSPMAEAIFNKIARERGLAAEAFSRGIAAPVGEGASGNAIEAAAELGCDLTAHAARQLTREDVMKADLIYTMSAAHAEAIKRAFPAEAEKVGAISDGPVPDPFGGDIDEYRACRDALAAAAEKIADGLENA